MSDQRWQPVCAAWVRRLAGYTGPIYLLTPRETCGRVTLGDALGLTSISMAADLAGILQARREWEGPGFATVVALNKIETTRVLLGVVLHEFAHHAESAEFRARFTERLGTAVVSAALDTPRTGPIVATEDHRKIVTMHGPSFQRLAAHLERRAAWAGLNIHIGAPWLYELSGYQLRRALADEPERLERLPLTDVAAIEPPETFVQFSRAAYDRAHTHLKGPKND